MIDFTKPVQTVGGKKVRILCTDAPGFYPIIGLVGDSGVPTSWDKDGYHLNLLAFTLMQEPTVHKLYINVWFHRLNKCLLGFYYSDKAKDYIEAEANLPSIDMVFVKTIEVEYEEK